MGDAGLSSDVDSAGPWPKPPTSFGLSSPLTEGGRRQPPVVMIAEHDCSRPVGITAWHAAGAN